MRLMLIVGVGSFLGGISRYILSTFIQYKTASVFPYGTLMVNLIGCFIIGCLFGLSERWQVSLEVRLFLVTGLLGGFTTFSAFSVETMHLIKSDNVVMAIWYVWMSIFLGLTLTFLGGWLFKYNGL